MKKNKKKLGRRGKKQHKKLAKRRVIKKTKKARKVRRAKKVKKTKKTKKTIKRRKAVKRPKRILKHKKTAKKIKRTRRAKKAKISKIKNYIGKGTLEQLFESLAKVKLMKFFFRNPVDAFQLREVLKMLRTNKSAIRQEINKLEKIGLIDSRKRQGRYVYSLNSNFDFSEELKNLVLKSTISSKSELINNVRKVGNIKLLVLGGIFRNNEADEADILIVGDKINTRKLTTFSKDLEAEVGKELNFVTMSAKEFNYRYDMYDRFVRDLINENKDILINKLNLW